MVYSAHGSAREEVDQAKYRKEVCNLLYNAFWGMMKFVFALFLILENAKCSHI